MWHQNHKSPVFVKSNTAQTLELGMTAKIKPIWFNGALGWDDIGSGFDAVPNFWNVARVFWKRNAHILRSMTFGYWIHRRYT